MSPPLVSVLLPAYDAAPYLSAALDSIVNQDYRRLEVIAIDDGSTDGTLAILERYRKADSRIRIVSRENKGLIATLNEGLALASGDLIARMDADDVAYRTRLSRQVALFEDQPGLAICGTGADTLIRNRLLRGTPHPIYRSGSLRALSKFFTLFLHSTVVYNRRVIAEDMLFYDARYVHAEDFDLFRRIAERHPAAMIVDSQLAYRQHEESVTARHRQRMRQTHLKIVGENLEAEALAPSPEVLRGIGDEVTLETVRGTAEFLLALDEAIAALPERERPSYQVGALNLFYFLYQMIGDEGRPALTHEFLTRTSKWGVIRRRERYGLRAATAAPRLSLLSIAAARQVDAVEWYMKSKPAAAAMQTA